MAYKKYLDHTKFLAFVGGIVTYFAAGVNPRHSSCWQALCHYHRTPKWLWTGSGILGLVQNFLLFVWYRHIILLGMINKD